MEEKCHFENTLRGAMRIMTGCTVDIAHICIVFYSLAVDNRDRDCGSHNMNGLTQPGASPWQLGGDIRDDYVMTSCSKRNCQISVFSCKMG